MKLGREGGESSGAEHICMISERNSMLNLGNVLYLCEYG